MDTSPSRPSEPSPGGSSSPGSQSSPLPSAASQPPDASPPAGALQQNAGCPAAGARGLIRFICSHNPFYVISAWFIFSGLRVSFDTGGESFETWALIGGLSGYVLLLAASACLLIRLGSVWEDVRSLIVLILLMFLAISVSLDGAIAHKPEQGRLWLIGAFGLAVIVSEALVFGLRVRFPWGYRAPYYLILSLFFLYPVALSPLVLDPGSLTLQWGLFGFSTAAGAAFLTLLPAVRRGPHYVQNNGTPWSWPMFPWTVFAVLGFAVCLRAYYLCESLHFVGGSSSIFGPYFLVPWFFAVGVLLLERAITSGRSTSQLWALSAPLVWLTLANEPKNFDPVHTEFLRTFAHMLHGSPLYWTLALAAAFYALAALRRVRLAFDAMCLSLIALAVIGPETYRVSGPWTFSAWPLLAVGVLQLPRAWRWYDSRRALIAACCLLAGTGVLLRGSWFWHYQGAIPAACLLVSLLAIGAIFRDPFARWLQGAAAMLMLAGSMALLVDASHFWPVQPWLTSSLCVLVLSGLAAAYGRAIGNAWFYAAAAGQLLAWSTDGLARGYALLKPYVVGLEQIAWGAGFFLLAMAISLWKTRLFAERFPRKERDSVRG